MRDNDTATTIPDTDTNEVLELLNTLLTKRV